MNGERSTFLKNRNRSGQAMLEYIIVFVSFFAVILVLAILLYALRQNGVRVLDLVSSEYP
jgi:hypothetical protein